VADVIQGKTLVAGEGSGPLLVSHEPLSFWGGYDAATGEIIDRRHPLSGKKGLGQVLALPGSRGSSTTTAVLLESIRSGAAPAAIILSQPDDFFSLAAIVADELYGRTIPIIQVSPAEFSKLESGRWVSVHIDGSIQFEEAD
jgi:predicted aconitase with swiveling domain